MAMKTKKKEDWFGSMVEETKLWEQQDKPNLYNNKQHYSSKMAASAATHFSITLLPILVNFLLVWFLCCFPTPVLSDSESNRTFLPRKKVNAYLNKITKPAVKSIQSPDGDVIDCVLSRLQPAFDHPKLRGHKPLDPPVERPNEGNETSESTEITAESFQLWSHSGESCPEGTVPIRRTTEKDVLRANELARFGKKKPVRHSRRDSTGSSHEHAVVFVNGEQYYGAKANINVWGPRVTDPSEFSLSQIWVISGSFGNDLNTIEAGWQARTRLLDTQASSFLFVSSVVHGNLMCFFLYFVQVSPELYGDSHPRFFTYWTTDAYEATGCYNLLCSGFVQTNNKIAIGAAISPTSSYRGRQFDISLMIWKDPKHGHWWLQYGPRLLVGYWPSSLFSHLRSHASMVQFGGEIVNSRSTGVHTYTQMGSGKFGEEGYGKASYFRNVKTVDWDNNLLPLSNNNLKVLADRPNCYDVKQGSSSDWGTYFYYGGPGRNVRCP
ncbi:hypothetical protein LINGRAHAP2_LOCUS16390 [Linum grandiflorum]